MDQTNPSRTLNSLRPRQNARHFKRISLNENNRISIKISRKFVSRGPINNIPLLVQIKAWRRLGDKPLYEPMVVRLPTHICVTRPQWVNEIPRKQSTTFLFKFIVAYMVAWSTLVQIMTCCLMASNNYLKMLTYCNLDSREQISNTF